MRRYYTLFACLLMSLGLMGQDIQVREYVELDQPTSDNLYLVGEQINIDQTVEGDLVAAGGEISLHGNLLDDVLLAGGSVNMDALCEDDLRMIGGEVIVSQDVMGDLLVMAGEVYIAKGVTIHGSLIGMAGELEIEGRILGDVRLRAGEIEIEGEVLGRMDIRGGDLEVNSAIAGPATLSALEIDLGSEAFFQSDVAYWSKNDAPEFEAHLAEGVSAHYDNSLKSELFDIDWEKSLKEGFIYWNGFRLFSGLLLTLVLFFLFGNYFRRNAGITAQATGSMLLSGLAMFVGLPVFSAFAFASIIGIPVGIISSAVFVIALLSSNALASVMGAYELNKLLDKDWSKTQLLFTSLGLFGGIRLLSFLPVVGGLASILAGILVIGYIIRTLSKRKRNGGGDPSDTELV